MSVDGAGSILRRFRRAWLAIRLSSRYMSMFQATGTMFQATVAATQGLRVSVLRNQPARLIGHLDVQRAHRHGHARRAHLLQRLGMLTLRNSLPYLPISTICSCWYGARQRTIACGARRGMRHISRMHEAPVLARQHASGKNHPITHCHPGVAPLSPLPGALHTGPRLLTQPKAQQCQNWPKGAAYLQLVVCQRVERQVHAIAACLCACTELARQPPSAFLALSGTHSVHARGLSSPQQWKSYTPMRCWSSTPVQKDFLGRLQTVEKWHLPVSSDSAAASCQARKLCCTASGCCTTVVSAAACSTTTAGPSCAFTRCKPACSLALSCCSLSSCAAFVSAAACVCTIK